MQNTAINIDKDTLGGTPVFRGTRVPISILFEYLEDNRLKDFFENYPTVSREQVREVIKIASKLVTSENIVNENLT